MVEGLKPDRQDATCKWEDSFFASLSMHLSVFFNIKCSLSCNVLIFQRWWLIWHDSSLIRAQTSACSAGVLLGETFILALDCSTGIQGLISLFFTCLPESAPCLFKSFFSKIVAQRTLKSLEITLWKWLWIYVCFHVAYCPFFLMPYASSFFVWMNVCMLMPNVWNTTIYWLLLCFVL